MPLMMVDSDVLHTVLCALEDNVDVQGLRARRRTPVLGLRAMVNEVRRAEQRAMDCDEPATSRVSGCMECGVLNDVSHCRECKAPLDVEPVTVTEGDLQPAIDRMNEERDRRNREAEARRQQRTEQMRVRDDRIWREEFERWSEVARREGREADVPRFCVTPITECSTCWDDRVSFVHREQDREYERQQAEARARRVRTAAQRAAASTGTWTNISANRTAIPTITYDEFFAIPTTPTVREEISDDTEF